MFFASALAVSEDKVVESSLTSGCSVVLFCEVVATVVVVVDAVAVIVTGE